MDDARRILSWVNSLPEPVKPDPPPSPHATRKRKTAPGSCLASPPATSLERADSNVNMTSTPKNSEKAPMARASSSKKQMVGSIPSETVEYRSLRSSTVPGVAKKLFKTMENLGRTHDIVPHGLRQTMAQKLADRKRREEFEEWRYCFGPEGAPDDLPGRIPSFEEIEGVLGKTLECENCKLEAADWNDHVYLPLLDSIFEDPLKGQCGDSNATIYTTARLRREFKPMVSTAQMIDICVFALLGGGDQKLRAAITNFHRMNPTLSINHADSQLIQCNPLILSIETKPDAATENAKLQMGMWHAARWAFLKWAVAEKLLQMRVAQGLGEPTADNEQQEFQEEQLAALSKLGFIPGVIVHGNRWLLVLSTYSNGKTTVWSECAFGTTQSEMGIYAVVAGVRELAAWGRNVYLPWFKENIFMLDDSKDDG